MDAHVAQGRPRRMWTGDIKNWTKLDTYEKIKRTAADRLKWRTYSTTCQPSTTEDAAVDDDEASKPRERVRKREGGLFAKQKTEGQPRQSTLVPICNNM